MEDIPRNAAGKPLRIKLAIRLGLGCLGDSVPTLHRHFEASTLGSDVSLSDPVHCSRVSVNVSDVEGSLLDVIGVEKAAVRVQHDGLPVQHDGLPVQHDGLPEAFVSTQRQSGLSSIRIRKAVSRVLLGYIVPELYVFEKPFSRGDDGQIDFAAMEKIIKGENSSKTCMSGHSLSVISLLICCSPTQE
jgi:hypothetical protein